MDPLCSSSLHPFSCSPRPIPIPNFFPRTFLTEKHSPELFYFLRATSHSSPKPVPSRPYLLLSLLKPISLTIATAAASFSILLSRFPSLSLASVSSPPDTTSNPLVQPDSDEIAPLLCAAIKIKIEQGDFKVSIQSLDQHISHQPANLDLPLLKAHLQFYMGDTNSAKRSFERLLKKDPYFIEAYHGLIIISTLSESYDETELRELMERVEKTIELCKKEKDGKEKMKNFLLLLGTIKEMQGEYEESLRVYGEMEKEDPTDFRSYLCQCNVYTNYLNKKEEADQHTDKYVKLLVPQFQLHPYKIYFDNLVARTIGEMEDAKKIGS